MTSTQTHTHATPSRAIRSLAARAARSLFVTALALVGVASGAHAADFEVAQIVPLSGPLEHVGREINAITQATLDDFNHANPQWRFVLKTYDDADARGTSAAHARHATHTAQALLSCFGTTSCLAQQQISSETGVPLIGPIAGALQLRGKQAANVYPVRASAAREVARLLSFADISGLYNMGVLIQDDAFGRAYAAELDKAVARYYSHIHIVRTLIDPAAPNYEAAVAHMQAQQPLAVVMLAANATHSSGFLNAWKRTQALPFVFNFSGQASSYFANSIKDYTSSVAFVTVTPSPWRGKFRVQRDYQRIAKVAGVTLSYLGFESYLNARTLIESVARSKANNKTDLVRWLDSGVTLDLGGYSLNWNNKRLGSNFTDLALMLPDGSYRH